MHVRYLLGMPTRREAGMVALSDFDGVHAGHLRLARRTAELAAEEGARAVAVILWPSIAPETPAITSLDERIALLEAVPSLDEIAILPIAEPAKSDIGTLFDILSGWYDVRAVAALDGALAQAFIRAPATGQPAGWPLTLVEAGDAPTTARVAELIAAGEVAEAARLLGHPYMVRGRVALGDQRGRLLGFPTANLRPDPRKVLPANGVYAVRARLPYETAARHPAVANIGVRPTFGEGNAPLIEVHLLEGALDLYGLPLTVELVERLRAEQRFSNVEALKAQMTSDTQRARELLSAPAVEAARQTDEPR